MHAAAPQSQSRTPARDWAIRAVLLVLSIAVAWALYYAIRRDGPAALDAWRDADVSWPLVLLATAFGAFGHVIYVVGWHRMLKDLALPVTFWLALRMYLVSNLGRYLPGAKAWQMGIVGIMAAEKHLPAAIVAGTSLLQGTVGVLVGSILLFATGGAALGIAPAWFALPIVGMAGVLAAPALLKAMPGVRTRVVHRLPSIDSVNFGTMWGLAWTAALSWIAWGVALYFLARALLGAAGASVIAYIAAWIGPFLGGVVLIVSPAGLGVRDSLMQIMLEAAGVATSTTLVVVVVARVWATILDVVPALVVLAIRGRRPPAPAPRA